MRPRYALVSLLLLMAVLVFASGCSTTEPTPVSPDPDTPVPPAATTAPGTEMPPAMAVTRVATSSSIDVALEHIQVVKDVPLARVNGDEIYWEDYVPSLYQALNKVSREASVDWSDPAMQTRLGQLQNDVLKQTADRWALRQLGEEMGLAVAPQAVEAEFAAQQENVAGSAAYESWDDYLARNGFSDASLRQVISDTLLLVAMIEAQEVDSAEEQVHLAHITVAEEDVAREVIARLDAGADFGELAAEYSEDPDTSEKGGELGWLSPTELMPELTQAIGPLSAGDYTEPIPNRMGFTIVLLQGREQRDASPQMVRMRQQEKLMAWFEMKKAEMTIELLVDFNQPQ